VAVTLKRALAPGATARLAGWVVMEGTPPPMTIVLSISARVPLKMSPSPVV
jgi:hypothetical protein